MAYWRRQPRARESRSEKVCERTEEEAEEKRTGPSLEGITSQLMARSTAWRTMVASSGARGAWEEAQVRLVVEVSSCSFEIKKC